MGYDFTTGGSGFVKATELVTSMYDSVESGFYDVLYPEVLWNEILPAGSVKTDINPGAQNYVYRSRDVVGMGQFVNGHSANIPRVGQTIGQVVVPILDAAVGATLMNSEVRRTQFGLQRALVQDYGEIMRKATDYHVERVFFFGDPNVNFESFLDYSTVPKVTIDNPWTIAEPAKMVADVNGMLTTIWDNSKNIHLPDTVFLPPVQFSLLTTAYVIGAGTAGVAVSALEYLRQNNIYTANTQKPLNIRSLRYLKEAGVVGPGPDFNPTNRAIAMEMHPRNFVMPFPLPYQITQPVPIGLGVDMFAEYIFGSFNVRHPACMIYADGI